MNSTKRYALCALVAGAAALAAGGAAAHRPAHGVEPSALSVAPYAAAPPTVSGAWTPMTRAFPGVTPGTAVLLTDGTVLMHDECTPTWYRLTPSAAGSYAAGYWTKAAGMPAAFAPLYFASAVLPDGRLIVNGGEYNGASCPSVSTNLGALFDPVANKWTPVAPPAGWAFVIDAGSVVLPNGQYMLQDVWYGQAEALATVAPLPATTVTWKSTGVGKHDNNDEEGWTLLANGNVLTVDADSSLGLDSPAELYSPITGKWTATGKAPSVLVDPKAQEIGPAVRLPSGVVFQAGANSCGKVTCKGHTALYQTIGVWKAGPDFPAISGHYNDVTDGPAAILPDGNVLIQTSPSYSCIDSTTGKPSPYCAPSHFFEFNGVAMVRVNEPADAPNVAAYEGRMLVLPTGQVLWNDTFGGAVEIYTPTGSPLAAWRPTIKSAPKTLVRGVKKYLLSGALLHGVSNGAAYGDDAQMNSNYPIIRITNNTNHTVCFARAYNHTSTFTYFDMPAAKPPVWDRACAPGASQAQVIVNGIASAAAAVTVQ
jgi:hypothetical protein